MYGSGKILEKNKGWFILFHLEQFAVHQSIQLLRNKDKADGAISDSGDPVANRGGVSKKRKSKDKKTKPSKSLKKNDWLLSYNL